MTGNRKSDAFGEAMLRMADARVRREIGDGGAGAGTGSLTEQIDGDGAPMPRQAISSGLDEAA